MRILYFSRDYTTHDNRFLTALERTGNTVVYLRLEKRGHQLEDRALPPQVEQVRWAGGERPFSYRYLPRLLFDLKRVIHTVKPDLIHAGPIQTCALLVALTGFHPLVSASWGSDLLLYADRSAWMRWVTRYTLRRSDALVGDCKPVRQKAVAFGMPNKRIVTFPWGVDLKQFSPEYTQKIKKSASQREGDSIIQRTGQPANSAEGEPAIQRSGEAGTFNFKPSTFKLLSVRGWEPIYGVDVIARAFVIAARQRPELQLIMLSSGSQADLLNKIFSDGGVLNQVSLPGQVSQADLPRYYRTADLYLSASHSDGTSISLLEAMASGCPALVSDIPGNREWVEPGAQGWWFPDGDVEALAESILFATDHRERLIEMGQAARRLAEKRADWEKNFPKLLEAYEIAIHSQ